MNLGWSQKKITLFFYAVTISIAVIALNSQAQIKLVAILLITALMIVTLVFVNKKLEMQKIK
ncbi:unnamed protein product [marine sediment metagenome]|uniref:Uncharacterized protein n=1 Tax=marine sediment metagenome TaxID=412755 RepID=X1E8P7_9ZZZZ